jgi:hypothetical protein
VTACRFDEMNSASYCSGEIGCSLRAGGFDWRGADEFAWYRTFREHPKDHLRQPH